MAKLVKLASGTRARLTRIRAKMGMYAPPPLTHVVEVFFQGHSKAYDQLLFKIAGKMSAGSGMLFRGSRGVRDHEFHFADAADADRVAKEFFATPGIERVRVGYTLEWPTGEGTTARVLRSGGKVARRPRRRGK